MHPSRAIRITKLRERLHMVFKPTILSRVVQFGADPRLLRILTHSVGLIALCAPLCGCNSVYHQTWATMPSDTEARLALRVKEAHAADRSARKAARQLLALLQQGGSDDVIQVGFDRLEKEALELNRKALAVRDELSAGVEVRENSEIEALSNQAKTWRLFVLENRSSDIHIAAGQLELLLGTQLVGDATHSQGF